MRHLPAFLDIAGRPCLVIGGGEVAARKIALLERAGGRVHVTSPKLVPSLSRGVAAGRIQHLSSTFVPEQLDGSAVVIAATDDRALNAHVSWEARRRSIPVNVVDDPALCTFQVPAIVDRSPVIIAISTGGASPVLARWVRRRIEGLLPASLGRLGQFADRWRGAVKDKLPSVDARKRFWENTFDGPAAQLALDGRDNDADRVLLNALNTSGPAPGAIYLVGAGPGDPELLTLRAHRLLQLADVVVHDRLVSGAVLDLARRDAELIDAGKAPGAHTMTQDEINRILIRLGRQGKQVVRLKGGDPFVFGRGGEEMLAVEAAGLPCHIVPGITAAAGIGAATGIPLTHRGIAQNVTYITGHTKDGEADADWPALARGGQTIVVYMGLAALPRITKQLLEHGLPANVPVAVIEKGTTPDQRVIAGTLDDIADIVRCEHVAGPALTIIGEVAAFARLSTTSNKAPAFAAAG
ncbi:MAG: uroporphyrin-III C-methyltransferase/precorrin-2 dehydrogenase/sirohydrochlorin ferrochelatase [Paracoccaceae bacterium]|jgi:uroporphyrin-III C-methyltransferase/precorrin-2 dehydrogenase/sirohydrochlorin ferrochelatase